VALTTVLFLFLAISYTLISTQAHLFVKNQLSERQTKQMEDVLLEIDDGVMILEEKENEEDKENSFSTVEFANSFMQRLFRSSFTQDWPESGKTINKLTKQPILSKTSK